MAEGMSDERVYRLCWEMVDQRALRKYCNADPLMFKNTTQTTPNSQIPDEDWYDYIGRTGSRTELAQQFNALKQSASEDRGFVRNVRLEISGRPTWQALPLLELLTFASAAGFAIASVWP